MGKISVIDCETDPFKYGRVPEPFIWGHYDGENYEEFNDTESVAKFLYGRKETVYAHNGGKFDYHFLLPFAKSNQSIIVINGRIAQFKIGEARMRDSYNLMPLPLARLNKESFDYAKMERDVREFHKDEISRYLYSDCVNLYRYVTEFVERYSAGLTLAGTAMRHWEKMSEKVEKSNAGHYEKFSPWYYGGRVSPFIPGIHTGKFEIYDINSAYPAAMINDHPCGSKPKFTLRPLDREYKKTFFKVLARSRCALPFREENGSVNYPDDTREFFATGWEIIAGIETGTLEIKKILGANVFNESVNFKEYVDHFYAEKLQAEKDGNKSLREFSKLFLNSLYGKYASNPTRYKEHYIGVWGDNPPEVPDGQEKYSTGALIGDVQLFTRPLPQVKHKWYDVVVAASITGWVRAFLWRSLHQVDTPYYCDTDSIICKAANGLKISSELGAWKHEGSASDLAIAGKKLYAAKLIDPKNKGEKYKFASKGVRISPQQIFKVASGKEVRYYQDAPCFNLHGAPKFINRRIKATI